MTRYSRLGRNVLNLMLTITPKPKLWKLWKKVKKKKKKWSNELKRATTTSKMNVAKVRAEPKTFGTGTPDINATATLP